MTDSPRERDTCANCEKPIHYEADLQSWRHDDDGYDSCRGTWMSKKFATPSPREPMISRAAILAHLNMHLEATPAAEVKFKNGEPVRPDPFWEGSRATLNDTIEFVANLPALDAQPDADAKMWREKWEYAEAKYQELVRRPAQPDIVIGAGVSMTYVDGEKRFTIQPDITRDSLNAMIKRLCAENSTGTFNAFGRFQNGMYALRDAILLSLKGQNDE